MNSFNVVSAILVAGTAIGCMVCGPLTGVLFQEYSPSWLIYLGLISSIVSLIICIVMFVFVKCFPKRGNSSDAKSFEL